MPKKKRLEDEATKLKKKSRATENVLLELAALFVVATFAGSAWGTHLNDEQKINNYQKLHSQSYNHAILSSGQQLHFRLQALPGNQFMSEGESQLAAVTITEGVAVRGRCFLHEADATAMLLAPSFDISSPSLNRSPGRCEDTWTWVIAPKHYGYQTVVAGIKLHKKSYRATSVASVPLTVYVTHEVAWDVLVGLPGILAAIAGAIGLVLAAFVTYSRTKNNTS